MKTYTITLQCTDNAGSTLQAYALQQYLCKNGIDNEIINYRPTYMFKYGNPLKRIIKKILFFKAVYKTKKKNEKFEKQYLKETDRVYKKYSDLVQYQLECDAFIVGSDQVWNKSFKCGNDEAFFLSFVPKGTKKVAYAASIGKENVPDDDLDFIVKRVADFDSVSVRELSSKIALEGKGISNVSYVCDPTLLLNREDYERIETKRIREKYILVYLVQPSDVLDALIEKIKDIYKCKVVLIYGVRNNCKCDIHLRDTSPDEFIGLIHNAEFVVASSFHAVMFSHIFEKNFAIVLPKSNQARIKQFLQISHLENRIVNTIADVQQLNPIIDYSGIRAYFDDFRKFSQKYIIQELKELKGR